MYTKLDYAWIFDFLHVWLVACWPIHSLHRIVFLKSLDHNSRGGVGRHAADDMQAAQIIYTHTHTKWVMMIKCNALRHICCSLFAARFIQNYDMRCVRCCYGTSSAGLMAATSTGAITVHGTRTLTLAEQPIEMRTQLVINFTYEPYSVALTVRRQRYSRDAIINRADSKHERMRCLVPIFLLCCFHVSYEKLSSILAIRRAATFSPDSQIGSNFSGFSIRQLIEGATYFSRMGGNRD